MKKHNIMNLKIEQRLKVMLNYLHFLTISSTIFALICFGVMGNNMSTFFNVQHETVKYQMEIRKDVQTISKRLLWAIIRHEDGEIVKEQQDDFKERFVKIHDYMDLIAENLNNPSKSENLKNAWLRVEEDAYHMMDLITQGNAEEAANYYDTTFFDVSEVLADALDDVGQQADVDAEKKLNYSRRTQILATVFLIIYVPSSLIFASYLSKRLINSIMIPLKEIKNAVKDIADGKLFIQINSSSSDEIGEVVEKLRESIHKVAAYVEYIDDIMETMAGRSFKISDDVHFEGDFQSIGVSLKHFTDTISSNMIEIGNTVNDVTEGSEQIAKTVQLLSDGSSEQADIVDTLSKTVSSVTKRIEINANDAADISLEVTKVSRHILEENVKMQEVVQAMLEISETSKEIEKIIGTINDIAAQTNLLALNASIEAARAGEAGRGFAVVADQVSLLASQSAAAVKTTTDYIQTALRAVEQGRVTADEAARQLDEVAANANAITGKVENIAKMSNEQAQAVKQINNDIEEINRVLDQNAVASKECSDASDKLAIQAKMLQDLILQFELKY